MTIDMIPARRNPDRRPSHPGELLREDFIPATKLTKADIATRLDISRQQLYDIMSESDPKPVTAKMAVRLGKLFGNGPDFWMNLQRAYDTWKAVREVDVSKIETLELA